MNATTIVGYTYQAENLHPTCAVLDYAGDTDPFVSVEVELDRYAERIGIDRMDETTFDSGDFPKVIFSSMLDGTETCGRCGDQL